MSDATRDPAGAVEPAEANRNRLVLALIAGLPLTMILAASWLWYFVARGELDLVGAIGTANNGELLEPPRQAAELGLVDQAGRPFDLGAGAPKWTLLVPTTGPCDAACEHRLYLTRQIHVAMGKEFNRLRRAWVSESAVADTRLAVDTLSEGEAAPDSFRRYLVEEQVGMLTLRATAMPLHRFFPALGERPDTWYLVDPAGWVMMAYDDDVGYRDVMADLKFLLKNSSG